MDLGLRGRTALVTGASQGIGGMVARMLAMEGVRVVAAARRVDMIEAMAAEVSQGGGAEITPMKVDFYPEGASEDLASRAHAALGRIDILMNAAGGSRPLPFEATVEQWSEGMLLNFFRIRELTHAVVPGMRDAGWGRVVTFTGTSEPRMLNAAFTAKAAVHVWSKGLSRELAPYGVTLNCLQPGRLHSEQIARRYPTLKAEQEFARVEIPAGRFGDPEEIAGLAVFLASARAAYVTGTVVPVDGGMSRFAF
jgi:3-oxoacyl-[acyl-carrier protein] reductase